MTRISRPESQAVACVFHDPNNLLEAVIITHPYLAAGKGVPETTCYLSKITQQKPTEAA